MYNVDFELHSRKPTGSLIDMSFLCSKMTFTLASKVTFKDFCTILDRISKAASSDKLGHLENFFKQCRILGEKIEKKDKDAVSQCLSR